MTTDPFGIDTHPDAPPAGDRWSTWDDATKGPTPRPNWVITELGAVDADLGLLKTGKEADVHLVQRWVPGTDRECLLAAKRYRSAEHRLFHRDAGYLEGRRVRRSRENRAMARRTALGKELIAAQWAGAEFAVLGQLWSQGLAVPYPVQLIGTELLLEFIGEATDEGVVAAPRLGGSRPAPALLPHLWEQVRTLMLELARMGLSHGDLSPYNVLLHDDRLVVIDWPQVVDIIGNPQGPEFLERDARTMAAWFTTRGYPLDHGDFFGELMAEATSRW